MIWLWSILAVAVLILIIPLGVEFSVEKKIALAIRIWFLRIPIAKKKSEKASEKVPASHEEAEKTGRSGIDVLSAVRDYLGNYRRFVRRRIKLMDFEFDLSFGLGDAAYTAIAVGGAWGIANQLLALINELITVKDPRVSIEPVFNEAAFSLKLSGIIKSNIARILAVGVIALILYKKHKKEAVKK